MTTQVTNITLLASDSAFNKDGIYAFQINSGAKAPDQGDPHGSPTGDLFASYTGTPPNPLILVAGDQITKVCVQFDKHFGTSIVRIDLTVHRWSNSPVTHEYISKDYVNNIPTRQPYCFQVPFGEYFVGFQLGGTYYPTKNFGIVRQFSVVTRSSTEIPSGSTCTGMPSESVITAIDLSSFDKKSMMLVLETDAQVKTISCTLDNGGDCSKSIYEVTVFSGTTPSLIHLTSEFSNTITFETSGVLANAGTYTVKVRARPPTTGSSWSSIHSATFKYVNPCTTATFDKTTLACFDSFQVYVVSGQTLSKSLPLWQDSVTKQIGNQTLICAQTVTQYVQNANPASANSTIHSKITYSPGLQGSQGYSVASGTSLVSKTQSITVGQTVPSEVGTYNLNVVACIKDNPNSCQVICDQVGVTVSCTQSVKILHSSPNTILSGQQWTISTTIPFQYQLTVDTSSTCGHSATSWTLTTTSTNNPTQTSNFQTISSSGLFSAGPFSNYAAAGDYNVSVASVVVNRVTYTASQITNTAASPNWFMLTVIDPCASATVTSITVLDIELFVQRDPNPVGTYPYTNFTYADSKGISNLCGEITYTADFALQSATNRISTFALGTPASNTFQVQSLNLNQLGTFRATLTGTLQNYQSRLATTTFTITVKNPCLITTIAPQVVQNFVSFAGYFQKSQATYTFNDSISESLTRPADIQDFCGEKLLSFSIDGTPTTTQLITQNTQSILFSPPLATTSFGTLPATLTVTMKDYPIISQLFQFNVTTLGTQITVIPKQTYMVNSAELSITFDPFVLLPQNFNQNAQVESIYSVYIVSSGIDLAQTDLTCSCLQLVQNQTWIKFSNQTGNTISIQTSDNQFAGQYQIAVVQTFTDYPQVKYFSQFVLDVLPLVSLDQIFLDLTPTKNLVKVQYTLGTKSPVINLLQYYRVTPTSQFEITFNAKQSSGMTIQNYTIDQQFQFTLNVNDERFAQTNAEFQIEVTTNLPNQIPNNDLVIQVIFKNIEIKLSDQVLQNGVASFEQKDSFIFQGVKLKPQTNKTDQAKLKYGALIQSISHLGLVTIQFYQQVHVPNFNFSKSTSSNAPPSSQGLDKKELSLTLQQFMDTSALDVKLLRSQKAEQIDWNCTSMTKSTLQIQLQFVNPLDISTTNNLDRIQVRFLQPKLFVLDSMKGYLFQEDAQDTLTAQVPPQFPSAKTLAVFTQMATSVNKSAPGIIILSLILQIIAKKVISFIFVFYSILQIILLISLHANVQLPASVTFIATTIDGIINLSSLDMKSILQTLKLPAIEENSMIAKLSGISLAILIVLVIGVVIIVLRRQKLSDKLKKVVNSIFKSIFWNFLIRYLQVAFINMNYAALTTVMITENLFERIMSAIILVVLYSLFVMICYILFTRSNENLLLDVTKQKIGNLYLNLETNQTEKTMFGALFFVQRILLVLIIANQIDFALQFVLIQITLMGYTIYLYAAKPYSDQVSAQTDYFNTTSLLFIVVFFVLASPYVTNTNVRFQYGIYFDCLIGYAFIANICLIALLSIRPIFLKFKRYQFRREQQIKSRADQQKKKQEAQKKQEKMQREAAAAFTNAVVKKNPLLLFQYRNPLEQGPLNFTTQQHDPYRIPLPKIQVPKVLNQKHDLYRIPIIKFQTNLQKNRLNIQQNKSLKQQSNNQSAAVHINLADKKINGEKKYEEIHTQHGFNKNRPKQKLPQFSTQKEVKYEIDTVSNQRSYGKDLPRHIKLQTNQKQFNIEIGQQAYQQASLNQIRNPATLNQFQDLDTVSNQKVFSPNSSQGSSLRLSQAESIVYQAPDFNSLKRLDDQVKLQMKQQARYVKHSIHEKLKYQQPQYKNQEKSDPFGKDFNKLKKPEVKKQKLNPPFQIVLEKINQRIFLSQMQTQSKNDIQQRSKMQSQPAIRNPYLEQQRQNQVFQQFQYERELQIKRGQIPWQPR